MKNGDPDDQAKLVGALQTIGNLLALQKQQEDYLLALRYQLLKKLYPTHNMMIHSVLEDRSTPLHRGLAVRKAQALFEKDLANGVFNGTHSK